MKTFVILASLLVAAWAKPTESPLHPLRHLPALQHEEVHDEFGQYALRYVTAEKTVVSERGRLVPNAAGDGGYVMVIEGQYEFIGDDGKLYVTKYSGGPDGFHVIGDHLPTPVEEPIPSQ